MRLWAMVDHPGATVRADRGGLVALHIGKEQFEQLNLRARVVEYWLAAVPSFVDLSEEQVSSVAAKLLTVPPRSSLRP